MWLWVLPRAISLPSRTTVLSSIVPSPSGDRRRAALSRYANCSMYQRRITRSLPQACTSVSGW